LKKVEISSKLSRKIAYVLASTKIVITRIGAQRISKGKKYKWAVSNQNNFQDEMWSVLFGRTFFAVA